MTLTLFILQETPLCPSLAPGLSVEPLRKKILQYKHENRRKGRFRTNADLVSEFVHSVRERISKSSKLGNSARRAHRSKIRDAMQPILEVAGDVLADAHGIPDNIRPVDRWTSAFRAQLSAKRSPFKLLRGRIDPAGQFHDNRLRPHSLLDEPSQRAAGRNFLMLYRKRWRQALHQQFRSKLPVHRPCALLSAQIRGHVSQRNFDTIRKCLPPKAIPGHSRTTEGR